MKWFFFGLEYRNPMFSQYLWTKGLFHSWNVSEINVIWQIKAWEWKKYKNKITLVRQGILHRIMNKHCCIWQVYAKQFLSIDHWNMEYILIPSLTSKAKLQLTIHYFWVGHLLTHTVIGSKCHSQPSSSNCNRQPSSSNCNRQPSCSNCNSCIEGIFLGTSYANLW